MSNTQLNAYYFSFEPTGVEEIDAILAAVAAAGKAFHNTSQWTEEVILYDNVQGKTPVDWIQNAAYNAANVIAQKRQT